MERFERHRHLIETSFAAVAPWFGIAAVHHESVPLVFSPSGLLWFALGMAYTQVFEYAYHRWVMHRGVRLLRAIQRKHLEHHRLFHGERFATRDPGALAKITGHWLLFPAALVPHALVLRLFLGPPEALSFLAGVVLHFVTFEVTHYFAHVSENGFDRLVRRLPLLREIRELQLQHHRHHHETPDVDFNFNPPFAVDVVLRTFCVGNLWMRRCRQRSRPFLQYSGSVGSPASGTAVR